MVLAVGLVFVLGSFGEYSGMMRALCELSALIDLPIQSHREKKRQMDVGGKDKRRSRGKGRFCVFLLRSATDFMWCALGYERVCDMCVYISSESHWLCIDEVGAVIYNCWSFGSSVFIWGGLRSRRHSTVITPYGSGRSIRVSQHTSLCITARNKQSAESALKTSSTQTFNTYLWL